MLLDLWFDFWSTAAWAISTSTGSPIVRSKSPDVWITAGNVTRSEGAWCGHTYYL